MADSRVKALTAFLIIGFLLLFIGILGLGLSDPFSSPWGWTAIIIIGAIIMVAGILFVTVKTAIAR
jgi:hypothetical protein